MGGRACDAVVYAIAWVNTYSVSVMELAVMAWNGSFSLITKLVSSRIPGKKMLKWNDQSRLNDEVTGSRTLAGK